MSGEDETRTDEQPATAPDTAPDADLCCSFCGSDRREVAALIRAAHANICESCVAVCVRVLTDDMKEKKDKEEAAGG